MNFLKAIPLQKFIFIVACCFLYFSVTAQTKTVTISGTIKDSISKTTLPYANVILKSKDQKVITGTVTNEKGIFTIENINPGNYFLEISSIGFITKVQRLFVGSMSDYLNIDNIILSEEAQTLNEVVVTSKQETVNNKMDKKTFNMGDNITQNGSSVLQAMQNVPGVTTQDGKLLLRGSDKIMVLIDGKQTALTGFNGQTGLDNIPASAIEKIEIVNNPSSKYDANGNAGIINIIYKKNKQEGFNGKIGITSGYGALWERKANLPTISPQYQFTPKINPSLSLNYKKEKVNIYFQGDYLYTETLNKNEFVTRTYDDGTIINQQTKRNRDTHFTTFKTGIDWSMNENNNFSFSTLFGSEKIIDHGEEPFFNADYSQRLRLWNFIEDELKTTITASATYQHKFKEAGHVLNAGLNYTFHREDEKYFFDNIMPDFSGKDAFKLLSDESVLGFNLDYTKPLKYGRFETGLKLRNRMIPTNMQFFPGTNSPIDSNAGGKAVYEEIIPAVYGNYVFETNTIEAEAGLRMEYIDLQYKVNPNHPTYKSDGYSYFQPFPNVRFAYKINENHKVSFFYNRRVDRPNEVDIRIFPKYDDAEIIKVGNPALKPQFTNSFELGYKASVGKGYFFTSLYSKFANGTITRIAVTAPDSNLIYNVFENAGKSSMTGIEMIFSSKPFSWYTFNVNTNLYQNVINAFTVDILYPSPITFSDEKQSITTGNIKWNNTFNFSNTLTAQLTAIYLAPDIIPQGKIDSRFSIDAGIKKIVQKGKGEFFINATDLLNTLVIKKEINGNGFSYQSKDYYETQVIRLGYNYKF